MTDARTARGVLALIVAIFLTVGVLYAYYTPAWQAPDEPAHYNYIAQVAGEGCCPVIAPGDWDADYIHQLTSERFPPGADLTPLEYEDHQPPLYYLLGSLVFRLTGGSLLALRLMSVVMGAGVVGAGYAVVARLFPARQPLALAVAAFIAFTPQHVTILASVNNDPLAELVLGVLLVVAVGYLGNPVAQRPSDGAILARAQRPHPALMGLLVGLAFLTKLTVYAPAVFVVAFSILLRALMEQRSLRWFLVQAAWAAGVALALGALWWVRNGMVYGWPDIFAQTAHQDAVVGQLRRAELIAEIGFRAYLLRLLTWTYHSFFGQFGWMAAPMSPRIYALIGMFLLVDITGLLILAVTPRRGPPFVAVQRAALWMLAALVALTMLQYALYNFTFVQFQGRYLFVAFIPLGLMVAAGLWGWARLLARWVPAYWRPVTSWLPLVTTLWLALLSVYALFRIVIPYLS